MIIHQFFKHNIFLNFISGAGGPAAVGTVGQDVEGYRSQQYSFDSTALERAAKAAKDLEKSAHATEALVLTHDMFFTNPEFSICICFFDKEQLKVAFFRKCDSFFKTPNLKKQIKKYSNSLS